MQVKPEEPKTKVHESSERNILTHNLPIILSGSDNYIFDSLTVLDIRNLKSDLLG